ncbi:NUDIX domain-containing protein [Nocardia sp. alder85J]|uniref:NUDIX domain-containing protein n=1 Tax=Nocardia sp. alder85J TaxID=2862949 RepID=UPI001CD29BC6|nr:NUDIX domain-containing protein [Nocardia sp. alder85J]MCX4094848.1 NUDIX domain-containing protein [Nocardia sp. alder85J]
MTAGIQLPMATPRIAVGIVVPNGPVVLMVKPTYKEHWDIPGGYVERGESPRAACEREVHEELGISIDGLHLAAVDWASCTIEGPRRHSCTPKHAARTANSLEV